MRKVDSTLLPLSRPYEHVSASTPTRVAKAEPRPACRVYAIRARTHGHTYRRVHRARPTSPPRGRLNEEREREKVRPSERTRVSQPRWRLRSRRGGSWRHPSAGAFHCTFAALLSRRGSRSTSHPACTPSANTTHELNRGVRGGSVSVEALEVAA